MIQRLKQFTDSINFTKAVIVTVAAVIPVLIFAQLELFTTGFAIALGAVLTYPADIPSNLSHRLRGLLAAASIITLCTLAVNLLHGLAWLFYPVVLPMVFFLSMISVYGQRATMVSFSGLLAIALATGHIHEGWEILQYCGLILSGGLFYTLISVTFNYFNPYRYTELQVAECLKLTGRYMKQRGHLWSADANRDKIIEKQLFLQVELNTTHQNLREVLLRSGSNAGNSNRNRKMLLVFISLMEIFELALSTSFDHSKIHEKFSAYPKVLSTYQNLAYNLASALKSISKSLEDKKKHIAAHSLIKDLESFEHAIAEYEQNAGDDISAEGVFLLTNMLHYAEKQIEKIKVIERALILNINFKDMQGRDRDLEKFLAPEYYPFRILKANLGLSSAIFRLSLRLTITIALGFIIGALLPLQNVYWILLTVVVIMRPGYGLTKQRSYQRIVGTVLGCVIAFSILYFVSHPAVIATLAIVCMLLGFTFTAINYRIGATFVTIYVVFIYSMLNPDISHVIQYRLLDTAVGALLAFAGNYFFWPSWEFIQLPAYIKKALEANRDYLGEISDLYNKKGNVPTSYRVARKNAFIEVGNLTASYQRMMQEPKSKQKQQAQAYKLAVLNHTLLSSLASLGTYIQSHHTSKASAAFNVVVRAVTRNLESAVAILSAEQGTVETEPAQKAELAARFTELKAIRTRELRERYAEDDEKLKLKLQEAQLIIEQLVWLNNISEKIVKSARQLEAGSR